MAEKMNGNNEMNNGQAPEGAAKRYVMVYGAGISGKGAAGELASLGKSVLLYDDNDKALEPELVSLLEKSGGAFVHGDGEKWLPQLEQLVLSPGVSIRNPLVEKAVAAGVEVISEIELAWRNYPGHMIAITGTNGKTTTTMLIGEMLKTLPVKTGVGGNIGYALSTETKALDKDSWMAAEVSSFQLEGVKDFRPDVAVVLNLTPDHIERHGTMEEYGRMKQNIFRQQGPKQVTVLNYDDPEVRTWGRFSKGTLCYFSRHVVLPEGVYMDHGNFCIRWKETEEVVCNIKELQIFGGHNEENILAAISCAYFAGVKIEDMRKVLLDFRGVEHRLEYVTSIDGVPYFNDSKATNTDSAIKALEAFPNGHIVLLAGGHDKMTDLGPMMNLARERVDTLILLGEAKERFAEAARAAGVKEVLEVGSFAEAVETAHAKAAPPQVVLLSPACSSFDMFSGFPERGRCFKKLVQELGKR